jgi:hypothetical protein
MERARIKQVLDAAPFVPFTVYTTDGDLIPVISREFAWLPPSGETLFVALSREDSSQMKFIGLSHISQLTVGSSAAVEFPSP